MRQTRLGSWLETGANIVIGFAMRDAARYRFIRRWARRLDIVGYCLSSENMEVRIDEAMSTADAPAAAMRETER